MKKKTLIFILTFLVNSFNLFSQKASGTDSVTIPRIIKFDERELTFNFVVDKTKLWIDNYTLALYQTKPCQNVKDILESNSAIGMKSFINSSLIYSKKFYKNVNKRLPSSAVEERRRRFESELDLLDEFVNSDEIVKNYVFNLVYNEHDSFIWITKNGVLKGEMSCFEFKKALFGICLSEKPIKDSLKINC